MTIKELTDIQNENRQFVSTFDSELIYSREYNCKKIDLFSNGNYVCSTNASKSLKLAKARLLGKHWLSCGCTKITAKYSKQLISYPSHCN
jgi:hypothetical protein